MKHSLILVTEGAPGAPMTVLHLVTLSGPEAAEKIAAHIHLIRAAESNVMHAPSSTDGRLRRRKPICLYKVDYDCPELPAAFRRDVSAFKPLHVFACAAQLAVYLGVSTPCIHQYLAAAKKGGKTLDGVAGVATLRGVSFAFQSDLQKLD